MRPLRLALVSLAVSLCAIPALAQRPSRAPSELPVVNRGGAGTQGLVGHPESIPMVGRGSADRAAQAFLRMADKRGAAAVGELKWFTRRGRTVCRQTLRPAIAMGTKTTSYDVPGHRRWTEKESFEQRVFVPGKRECWRAVRPPGRYKAEVHGVVYYQQVDARRGPRRRMRSRPRVLSPMERMADQLE